MIYEQRIYNVSPAHRGKYIKWLGEEALPIIVKHGAELITMWETLIGERNQVIVLLGWKDYNQRWESWNKIFNDTQFACLMETCFANSVAISILGPTKYSPMK